MKKVTSLFLAITLIITTVICTPFVGEAASSYETEATLSSVAITDWMSAIRGETKLTEITIPGTHDSCARKFHNEDAFGVTSSISKCQSMNITQQLNSGVRYLDIRCEVDASSKSVKTVHGSTDCWNGNDYYYLDYVLQDVYDWLASHPSETVLISIKEDDGDVGAPTFTEAIYEYIHGYGQNKYFYGESYDYTSQWYLGKSVPTLDEVRGKCVLMNRFDQYIESSGSSVSEDESGQKIKWGDQSGSDYSSPVYNTYYNNNTGVGSFHVQDHYEWSTSNKLSATQEMLSLGHYRGEYYINFTSTTTGATIPCPEDYAKTINARFSSLTFNKTKPSGIIAMDFITADLARVIVENNEAVSTIVTGTDGSISYTLNRLTGVLTINGSGDMKDYEYSSTYGVDGAGSTAPWGDQIKNSLFDGQYNTDLIKTIVIGEGVTSIGAYAFYGFDNVTSVTIPSSVKSIGEGAFTKCSSLTTVDISKTAIKSIDNYAFKDCTGLKSFYTSNKVNSIGTSAFANDSALTMYGAAGIYSESYASDNSIKYVTTGTYDEDTDWFTSKATYYEQFSSNIGGTAVTATTDTSGNPVSWQESYSGRQGVAFLPWSIERSGQNYINTGKSALAGEQADGVTISFFKQIGGNYYDGAALTLAKSENAYLAIYDNGKIYYSNNGTNLSYTSAASQNTNKVWQYFTVSITDSIIKFYVNGVLDYTITNTVGSDLIDFLCDEGTMVYPGSFISRGTCTLYLDEISVLPVAVGDDEAKAMYYSYTSPSIIENDICSTDSNIKIMASNGYENVIYTHGENTLTTTPLNMAADYMFKGDEIADGDNDGAYVYSTTAAGQENELYTTLTINSKYSIRYIGDQYENYMGYYVKSSTDDTVTYVLCGNLGLGYVDGSDDDLELRVGITDGTNYYEDTKYVHITQHPVSANASAAIYRSWSGKTRDSGLFMKAVGSTGKSSTYYSGNYVFTSTPVFIGNGWGFASNTNADSLLMVGDGSQGDDSSSAFPSTSSTDIVNAGVYAQSNSSSDGDQQTVTASGTTANYYVDLSNITANSSIGGVNIGSDKNSFTIDTIVTRLAPMGTGTTYNWSSSSISSSTLSWNTSLFTSSSAESIGAYGTANSEQAQAFSYIAPAISGSLSNGSQTATITAGLNHSSSATYTAQDSIDINLVVYDKSELRNLVNECEAMHLTGKGASQDDWNNYTTALANAYANLNDYKNSTVVSASDSIYKSLLTAKNAFSYDTTAYLNAINTVKNTISSNNIYTVEYIEPLTDIINSADDSIANQSSYDIMTGKIYFYLRFIEQLDSSNLSKIDDAVNARTDAVKYNVDKIKALTDKFYNDISYTCTIDDEQIVFLGSYSQENLDGLIDYYVSEIEACNMTYSITTKAGSVVKADNPFAGSDLSNGVTISFKKYCSIDAGWDNSLISFSTGNNADNRYFIIMGNGTVLFNDGNGGISGYNGCYFDINRTSDTNSTADKWVDITLSIYKDSSNNHILDYYIDNVLAASYDLSSICAWGYPNGVSGSDGIFSFLSSNDINLYYGASFTTYGSMAGTRESYLDDVSFCDYAKSKLEVAGEDSTLTYSQDFTNSVGGTATTGTADGGYSVYNQTTDNNGRSNTVYFPYSGTGSSATNYVNTGENPFANADSSKGLTISYWQRINGNYYGDRESITFAQGDIGENKYFTIGTDGYIRFNNGNGGSDSSLTSAGLYFDYTTADSNIIKQQWQLVTLEIVDDYNFNLYINGKLSKSITVTGTSNYQSTGGLVDFLTSESTTMYLGSYTPYWGTCTLSLDNVKCFNTLLGEDNIYSLYALESGNTAAIYNDSFDSAIPTRVSGSCKWVNSFGEQNGVLYIPSDSADGSVAFYVNGVETSDVSAVPYGSTVVAVYDGIGVITDWHNTITNANGSSSDSSLSTNYEFVLTGNSVIDYDFITSATDDVDVDESALIAAIDYSSKFSSDDYSPKSYSALLDTVDIYSQYVAAGYNQYDIDLATSAILTAISNLVPYVNISVSASGGTAYYSYIDNEDNVAKQNVTESSTICFGSQITAVATANDDNEFIGWYEIDTGRLVSTDLTYSFLLSSNTNIQAKFKAVGSTTLTFSNDSGWVSKQVTKSTDEWAKLTSIDSLLPNVPYQLGYTNGKWNYDNDEVLAALQNGEDVTIYPTYDVDTEISYQIPEVTDTPVAKLYYTYDSENSVGSFTMALGVPEGLDVQEIGIAFYRGTAATFDPSDYALTINNKNLVSKFNDYTDSGIYTVDIIKMSAKYNWAAVGYVTYLENGTLKVAYSNQINVVNGN